MVLKRGDRFRLKRRGVVHEVSFVWRSRAYYSGPVYLAQCGMEREDHHVEATNDPTTCKRCIRREK